MAAAGDDVYCTLLLSDGYLPGAMVLAHSLKDAGTKKKLAVLVTPEQVSGRAITELKTIYDHVIPVNRLSNKAPANLFLMGRGELGATFTKVNLWRQSQFRKIVYIDADVVAVRAPDELFDLEERFAAAPDVGWPDCFNSGVMALTPNMGDYYSLLALAQRGISFDGADQGLLNTHFKNYHRLSFSYNCTPSAHYQYVPAYRHFQSSISMVHFIGADKPWQQGRETMAASPVYDELLGRWWSVYDHHFRVPMTAYVSGQSSGVSRYVQQFVKGEKQHLGYGYSSVEPTVGVAKTEEPVSETASAPPVQTNVERRFSAPSVEWDPTRSAPPAQSKPEAANFQTSTYEMSSDRNLFKAPASYPQPPTDLSYNVPGAPRQPEVLKPLFPWEEKARKPTRRFADDDRPSPSRAQTSSGSASPSEKQSPATPTITVTSSDPWKSFSSSNTWDQMPEIERYMRNFSKQPRRGKVQVLIGGETPDVESPTGRRPSMKVTDFPTEIERPSLPVTPAPVRRPSFWGAERDEEGELPAAEGVPKQEDWDPSAKLEELSRRQSAIFPKTESSEPDRNPPPDIPERELPSSAMPMPSHEVTTSANQRKTSNSTESRPGPAAAAVAAAAPSFSTPNFSAGGDSTAATGAASQEAEDPTERIPQGTGALSSTPAGT